METIVEDILRWSPERIKELQGKRLREAVSRCFRGHPHYRKLMERQGITPDDIQTIDDLENFPVTTKADFVANPEAFRLQLDDLPVEDQALSRIIYTTGSTTGVPAPVYVTAADHYDYMLRSVRRRDFIDIRKGDLMVSLFPLTPYPMGAAGRAIAEASACGAALLETNPGHSGDLVSPHRRTAEIMELVLEHQPHILWGIPSYVLKFLKSVASTGQQLHRLRVVMVTGEGLSKAMEQNIRDAMTAVGAEDNNVVNRYGSTEQGSAMVECVPGSGFHDLAPDSVFMEVLDPETGKRCPDGVEGELAFTHLNRSGTTLLRFAVGDRAVLSHEPCPHCGRTGSARMVSGPFRSGDIVKVKGTLVNLAAMCDLVSKTPGVEDMQVIVEYKDGLDSLRIRVAPHESVSVDKDSFVDRVQRVVQKATSITPQIETVSMGDLIGAAAAGKLRRVIDQRKES
ncbi:AMP-binding protein [Arthrobacter sp. APC 3897]|uniref:phenylacetate--CoA ligase family protein n=1 Tax=Arthrobacter sp. APC 3897 TaxID=3035204 RepID=UPI0025B5E2A5|nr:AMP-binding protein [Arthrobacter sp. APC 3897]MDN3480645.1 AMP-binding protein [Arthrobacter sp. APC 3897]